GSVRAILDPQTGRFPGNFGPDIVVDLRTQSLQDALDHATDTNGDGYIIIGVIGKGGQTLAPGGSPSRGKPRQQVQIDAFYDKPFALLGCGVTLRDPLPCDGSSPVQITANAGSPEFPVGSGVTLYIQDITVENSVSAPALTIAGNGRYLESVSLQGSLLGLQI